MEEKKLIIMRVNGWAPTPKLEATKEDEDAGG